MSVRLTYNSYGKHRVRVSKIKRPRQGPPNTERHEFIEAAVDVELEGDFAAAYTAGDNTQVVATDTCKNTVYAVAKDDPFDSIESFGTALASHFIKKYAHVSQAKATLLEHRWHRLLDCPHAFSGSDGETPTAVVTTRRGEPVRVSAGIEGLVTAKTTETGFENFHRDEYRTLPDTADRIFATELTARWDYAPEAAVDYAQAREAVRLALLKRFIDHYSKSVQETLMLMGQAALDACEAVAAITLTMPNKHDQHARLVPGDRPNENEVFVATDEPFGWITGTVTRT